MTATAHLYEIFIRAPRERVWHALTDPDDTVRYFHGTRFDSTFEPGSAFRNVIVAGEHLAVDGVVETYSPPHRLVITWHVNYDPEMAAEPAGRVEWTLTPAGEDGSVTRVTLRHGDLALSPKTWEHVRLGWVAIIDSLKSLLETGEPLPDVDTVEQPPDPTQVEGNWHRAQAIEANNSVWELLDDRQHSPAEADELLQRAYAAAYHWARATGSTPLNSARGLARFTRTRRARARRRRAAPCWAERRIRGGRRQRGRRLRPRVRTRGQGASARLPRPNGRSRRVVSGCGRS